MRYFCTYFDHRYLNRGLALYKSLTEHCAYFQLSILCLNDLCFDILSGMKLPNVTLVRLSDFEKRNPELIEAKQNRSLIEYYFTCTPVWMSDVFNQSAQKDLLTYLDADLFFFGDPEPLYEEIGTRSIAIIPHRFSVRYRFLEEYGLFNVGWITIRRDAQGLACLARWQRQCLEWCYDVLEKLRFADQKYLDEWPARYQEHIAVIGHPGANLAPWNVMNYELSRRDHQVWLNRKNPLIFYHFHKLKFLRPWLFNPNILSFGMRSFYAPLKWIYQPYLRELILIDKEIAPAIQKGLIVSGKAFRPLKSAAHVSQETLLGRMLVFLKSLPAKQYVFFIYGKVV